jgi:transcriptional regulator with XRE-family HTH domain
MPRDQGRQAQVERMIGQRLRQLRMQLGMSQTELGAEVGLTFQQIQKYEHGKNRISVSRMLEFTEALQTTPNDIIGWKAPNGTRIINSFSNTLFEAAYDFAQMPEEVQIAVRSICSATIKVVAKRKR